MKVFLNVICAAYFLKLLLAKKIYILDESWVCNTKTSCSDCLRLTHCSWCEFEKKCFSKKILEFEDFCKDNIIDYKDFKLSFEGNAECTCFGAVENNCKPPGDYEGTECSGRGQCICGRCLCDPSPDPDHPTKTVMGEFCEFDNFSCDGPKCNEGPYSLSQPKGEENMTMELEDM